MYRGLMYLQLAWRNIWRNPRRTLVILTAIVIGIWSMIFICALMRGMTDQMIENSISILTGHIQIHHRDYRRDPVIENSMRDPQKVRDLLEKVLPPGSKWASRIRVGAVAANARHSTGVTLVGVEPEREAEISFIGNSLTRGRFLNSEDQYGIVVGRALADKFETRLGRKLVLMSQDTGGELASRAFKIVGIFRSEMESTEKQFVFVSKGAAGKLLKLETGVSEFSIPLPEQMQSRTAAAEIRAGLSGDYSVETWQELLPMIVTYMKLIDAWVYIWNLVVFIAMGFGIVNTLLMAVFERMREFGLLKALGMKASWIVRDVLTESFLLLIAGMGIGNLLAWVSVAGLAKTGINLSALAEGAEYFGMPRMLYPAITGHDVTVANLTVVVLGLLISLYPALKAARFTPVEAMAHT